MTVRPAVRGLQSVAMEAQRIVRMTLLQDHRTVGQGQVDSLTSNGASAHFAAESGPRLVMGQLLDLRLGADGVSEHPHFDGQVVERREEGAFRRYSFHYSDPGTWDRLVQPFLATVLNRRRAPRVIVPGDEPVSATATSEDGRTTHEVEVHDLSAVGAALRVSPGADADFCTAERLRISLRLPGQAQTLTLDAILHYRRLAGPRVHYGVEFLHDRTPASRNRQEAIFRFVFQRQQGES